MFVSSLDQLVATPGRYGWTWDFAAVPDDPSVFDPQAGLYHTPGVAAAGELDHRQRAARRASRERVGIHDGCAARSAPRSLRGVHRSVPTRSRSAPRPSTSWARRIGDTVHGAGPDGSHDYRIVGRAVFPRLDTPQPLANGAAFAFAGLDALLSQATPTTARPTSWVESSPVPRVAAVERRVAAIPGRRTALRSFGPGRSRPSPPGQLAPRDPRPRSSPCSRSSQSGTRSSPVSVVAGASLPCSRRSVSTAARYVPRSHGRRQRSRSLGSSSESRPASIIGNLVWRLVADGLGVGSERLDPTPCHPAHHRLRHRGGEPHRVLPPRRSRPHETHGHAPSE